MSRVQAGAINTSTSVTTQTTTLGSVVAAHLLELTVFWDLIGTTSVGTPTLDATATAAGWLPAGVVGPVDSASHSGSYVTGVSKFYLQNCPSGSVSCKVNFPATAFSVSSQIVEYSGYATSGALDKVAVVPLASGTTVTVTTAATAQANELVTASVATNFAFNNSATGLTDPPTGYLSNAVNQDTNGKAAFESSYKEVTSTGAQSATWSWSGTGEGAALIVTYGTSAATPATLSSQNAGGTVGATTATPGASTNQGSGTGYVVVTTAALTGVTAAQVKAGQNASGSTTGVTSGNVAISATGAFTVALSGLTQSTAYNFAVVQSNANGDSNVVTGSFTTTASPPVVTSPTAGAVVAYLAALVLAGSNFGATQGAGAVTIGGVAQTETAWADTGATITSVARGALGYGSQNLVASNNGGGTSSPIAVTLTPQSGWAYVTIGPPNTTATNRVTATPDLASGDQVAYDTKGGLVVMNTDGTFTADPSVVSFTFEVWTPGSGWGSTGTATLQSTPTGTVVVISW